MATVSTVRISTETLFPGSEAGSSLCSILLRDRSLIRQCSCSTESPAVKGTLTLRRAGFHVMTFHYSGNWGSDGNYSLINNLEDANTVLDFILNDDTYGFDKMHIYAVGHSLGGFVCGQLVARRPELQGGVLLMPCDIGRLPQIAAQDTGAYLAIRKVLADSAQWLTGVTREALLREAEAYSEEFRLESVAGALAKKPLLCVAGSMDACTPPAYHCEPLMKAIQTEGGTLFRNISYSTDHFFADYRLTVAEAVTDFLTELLPEPRIQN